MVNANRAFVLKSMKYGFNYPIHLGVTEAGEGEDGRVKSSIGISTLLEESIGDTIRVSLTEDSINELPVAEKIVKHFSIRNNYKKTTSGVLQKIHHKKRETFSIGAIGGDNVPKIICNYKEELISLDESNYDYCYVSEECANSVFIEKKLIYPALLWKKLDSNKKNHTLPLLTRNQYIKGDIINNEKNFLNISINDLDDNILERLANDKTTVIVFDCNNNISRITRDLFKILESKNIKNPVIFKRRYSNINDIELLQIKIAGDLGGLFLDGFGNGLWLDVKTNIPIRKVNEMALSLLQGARVRIDRTEYISCPSCGRTTFNIQDTLQKIKSKTSQVVL